MKSKNRIFLQQVGPHAKLYRDAKTGIAWVEDGSTGTGHSCHPNISRTGSIRGMRARGWGKDRVVRSHGFIYNIDRCVVSDEYDNEACESCRCGGYHNRAFRDVSDYEPASNTRPARQPGRLSGFTRND